MLEDVEVSRSLMKRMKSTGEIYIHIFHSMARVTEASPFTAR